VGIRLLTQFVSPEVYGSINLLLGVSALVCGILSFPVSQAALRYYPEEAKKDQTSLLRHVANQIVQKRTVLLLAVILIFGAVYSIMTETSFWVFIALAIILIVDIIRGMQSTYLAAARRHKVYSLWNVADAWVRPLSVVLVAIFIGTSLQTILFGYVMASAVLLVIITITVKSEYNSDAQPNSLLDPELSKEIRKFALPLLPLIIVGWISGLSDRYIVGGILGLEQVGIYSAVYGLISRPFLMAGAIIEQTLRPVYFEAIAAGNHAHGKKTFSIWIMIAAAVCGVGIVAVILLRGPIGTLLLAEKYRSGIVLMPWIALGYSLLVMSTVFEKPCYAYKKTRAVLFTQSGSAVASICIAVPMIYKFGLRGAAFSIPLYFGVQLLLSISISRRIMRGQ
jgi:O-antigen/teichoic acid export membrane protein